MKKICKLISIVALVIVLSSCNLFMLPFKAKMGTIRIQLNDPVARTVHPFDSEAGMTVESYAITFTAPDGASDEKTAGKDGLVEKKDAIEGSWTVEARALNAAGGVLGKGHSTVEVVSGKIQTVRIEIKPSGIGTISIKIDWKDNPLVEADYVAKAFLVDEGVDPVELTLTTDTEGKSASWSASTIAAGSHEIIARLIDTSGKVLWGQIESFMVYEGLTSSKTFVIAAAQMNRKPEAAPSIGAMERAPNQIAVNWSCTSARVDKYRLEKKVEPDGSWIFLAETTYTATRYVDTSVVQGASYSYRVRASNTFGETDWSAARQVSVPKIVEVTGADNTIKTDTTWTSENTYEVENIQINAGVTLTIQPGTRIIFRRNDLPGESQYYMVVKGTLKALGTTEEPIVFTTKSSSPVTGSWSDLRFVAESADATFDAGGEYVNGSILRNCILEYTKGITITDSTPYLDGVTLRYAEGLWMTGNAGLGKVQRIKNLTTRSTANDKGILSSVTTHELNADGIFVNDWRYVELNGKVNIKNFNSLLTHSWSRYVYLNGTIKIDGGSIKNARYVQFGEGTFTINGMTFESLEEEVRASSNSNVTLMDCKFLANRGYQLKLEGTQFAVKNSSFDKATSNGVLISSNARGEFSYNTIKNSIGTALLINNPGAVDFHHNSIIDNTSGGYAVSVTGGTKMKFSGNNLVNPKALREIKLDGVEDFWAGVNWWGSSLKSVIDSRVYDGYDTFDDGYVRFDPPMSRIVSGADTFVLPDGSYEREVFGKKAKLNWRAVGEAPEGYRLQVSRSSDFSLPVVDSVVDTQTNELNDLELGDTYYWRVAAVNDGVEGVFSPYSKVSAQTLVVNPERSTRTIAISSSGTVYNWGASMPGFNQSYIPVKSIYKDFLDLEPNYNYKVIGLKVDGSVWSWGSGEQGQLGLGTTSGCDYPKQVDLPQKVRAAKAGHMSGFALLEDGSLFGWGYNYYNQVSSESTDPQLSPINIIGIPKLKDFSIQYHQVLGLDFDGGVWAWGMNNQRQCTDYDTDRQSIPEKLKMPVTAQKISAGYSFNAILGTDHSVYGRGYLESVMYSPSGVQKLSSGLDIAEIAAGGNHLLMLASDGSLYSIGGNGSGQLGTGDTTCRSTPTKVTLPTPVISIAASQDVSFAIDADGRIWAWGYNGEGSLGDGTTSNRINPVEIFLP